MCSSDLTSSLTTVGTIGTGVWQGTAVGSTYGGTGQTTVTTGDLLYGSATNTWSKLGIGTTGQILRVVSGAPAWGTDYLGTVTSVGGTGTVNGITLTGTVTSSGNLTLGGTLSGVSLTTQVSGTLPVANGGTGLTTLTAGYIPFGNGSSAFSSSSNLFWNNSTIQLGIGTSSPYAPLTVRVAVDNDVVTDIRNTSGTNPYGMRVGLTGASPNNGTNYFLTCPDSTTTRASILSNGGISNYAANNVILSDRREKINFSPAKSYLDVICAIPVQTFNYIDQNLEIDGGLTLGVVAQDVQAVAPELVTEGDWGTKDNPKMRLEIYQTDLQYALMKCIQELKADFDLYKALHP